jgi:hypothetical protein
MYMMRLFIATDHVGLDDIPAAIACVSLVALKAVHEHVDARRVTDSATPVPDLFDESRPSGSEGHLGAISPMTYSVPADDDDARVPIRWRSALVAGLIGVGVGLVSNFPNWAVAVLGVGIAAMYLRTLPSLIKRIWLIAVGSFFFAQCTTIFINIPFTWIMRFLFCAVLLTSATYLRVNGDE